MPVAATPRAQVLCFPAIYGKFSLVDVGFWRAMRAFFTILFLPLVILNSLAGVVGGAWLLWLGEWKLVLGAFTIVLASSIWASILLLPTLLVAAPSMLALDRGYNFTVTFLATLGGLWTYSVVAAWCLVAFWYIPLFRHDGSIPVLPYLLYAYSVATTPWAALAQRETRSGNGEGAELTVSAACVGSALLLGYAALSHHPKFLTAIWFLIVPMALGYVLSVAIAISEGWQRARPRY